jgi:predicted nuclease of predicted toxin-antitoxin system
MRFLVDECTGPAVARWLQEEGHEVYSVYDESPGLDDDGIIHLSFTEAWILITNDKDFGEKVYREQHRHRGVILLRLEDERVSIKIETLKRLLIDYADRLVDNFVVVTEKRVRFAKRQSN